MKDIKYSQILKLNKEIGANLKSNPYNIIILSNITVHQIKEILEYSMRSEGINASVEIGDYDNIVQDSLKYQDSNIAIIFWELSNIVDGFQYRIELLNDDQLDEIFEKTKSEIDLVLKNLEKTPLILINKFTSLHFSNFNIRENNLDIMARQLNKYLVEKITANVRLIDLEKVIANVGVENSLDLRYFYSSKALYTVTFFKEYAKYIKPLIMFANGKTKKALIFDCDNTLWKGILGEDGFDEIEMSQRTKDGAIFSEIQTIAKNLCNQGVLIGLCSKNNPGDIKKVIKTHPDMQLREEQIVINKSNWNDKVSNLKEIANELNIGLDTLVFVDDSSFEVNLIKEFLPMVLVLQVPERFYEYPKMLRENIDLFYNFSLTDEDIDKIEMYKKQIKRVNSRNKFADIEDYLASLKMKMPIYLDDESTIPRLSQMSLKTNQFNLTTKRYTEGDIKKFIDGPNSNVYGLSVVDKFGDSGVTGLCIINIDYQTKTANIDTLLMSCRIIGRNVEYAFIDNIIDMMRERKVKVVTAKYIKTQKNEQVKEFYEKCSFILTESCDSCREYTLDINNYIPKKLKYIDSFYAK